jgi:hypothetical protein
MTSIYFPWKLANTTPAGFSKLTRSGKYIRLTDNTALHLTDIGSLTHGHALINWACDLGDKVGFENVTSGNSMSPHAHGAPISPTISSNYNNPLYYSLDLVYMDLGVWEATMRMLPAGMIVLSNAALSVDAKFARFADADGRFISLNTPGSTGGSSTPQSHRVTGVVQDADGNGPNWWLRSSGGSDAPYIRSHNHPIDIYSDAVYAEPRSLTTRLYEAISDVMKVQAGIVAFVDGTPTSNWEILSSWANANLKAGNSDPALAGLDYHAQSISGRTGAYDSIWNINQDGWSWDVSSRMHTHGVSATLQGSYHIPLSSYLIPVRLKYDLWRIRPSGRCVMC